MRLNQEKRGQVLNALNDVFSTVEGVKELALEAASRSLDQVALGPDLPAILSTMVEKAQDEGWVGNLLDAATRLRPKSTALKRIRSELDEVIVNERKDHFATCWLLGDRVLLDRKPLRDALTKLSNSDTGKHILIVQGPSMSGKSHSHQMIRYLQDRSGGFGLVWVDLDRLAALEKDKKVRPENLGQSIADQMGLSGTPQRQREQYPRWAQRFCDWLTGQLAGKDRLVPSHAIRGTFLTIITTEVLSRIGVLTGFNCLLVKCWEFSRVAGEDV